MNDVEKETMFFLLLTAVNLLVYSRSMRCPRPSANRLTAVGTPINMVSTDSKYDKKRHDMHMIG